MFVGHYSVAFAAKSDKNKIPLWVLFVAVQFLDYIWATLVLLGIEKLRVIKGFTTGSMLDSYFHPYSHSLITAILWSCVAAIVYKPICSWLGFVYTKSAALIIGVAVFSHWILDLIVHAPDLLIYGSYKMGFALWNYFWPEFVLEIALLLGTLLWYLQGVSSAVTKRRAWLLFVILIAFQCFDKFGPPPAAAAQMAASALIAYSAIAALAAWVDKKQIG